MTRTPRDVTAAELAVLQVLWDRGTVTTRQITEIVYPDDIETQYSTVKRLLARLEDKGYVRRDRSKAVHIFEAAVGRDDLVGHRLEAVVESLCDGSISPLLTHLSKAQALSKGQQDMLRQLIQELDESNKSPE